MRLLVLSAAIAATVLGAIPASAEVVIRAGEGGVAIHDRDSYRRGGDNGYRHREEWRRHRAECREVRVRTRLDNGRVVFRTQRTCN
jgi:hypothetical protein